jgi:hypothetical protein
VYVYMYKYVYIQYNVCLRVCLCMCVCVMRVRECIHAYHILHSYIYRASSIVEEEEEEEEDSFSVHIVPLVSMAEDSFRVSRASQRTPPLGRVTAEDENRTSVKRDLL